MGPHGAKMRPRPCWTVCMNGRSFLTKSSAHPCKAWLNRLYFLTVFVTGAHPVEAPFFECVAFWRLWSAYPFEGLLKQGSILCGLLFERILSLLRVSQGCLKALLERTPSILNRILSVIKPCWTVGLYERTLVFNKIERPSCKAWLNRILSLLKLYLQGSYLFSLFVVTGARPC